jgi:hypothetical protein
MNTKLISIVTMLVGLALIFLPLVYPMQITYISIVPSLATINQGETQGFYTELAFGSTVTRVDIRWYVDGSLVFEEFDVPYGISYYTTSPSLSAGTHQISVVATINNGESFRQGYAVLMVKSSTPTPTPTPTPSSSPYQTPTPTATPTPTPAPTPAPTPPPPEDTTKVAVFVSSTDGGNTVPSTSTFEVDKGSDVTITAAPFTGYEFDYFLHSDGSHVTDNPATFNNVQESFSVIAVFKLGEEQPSELPIHPLQIAGGFLFAIGAVSYYKVGKKK